MTDKIFGTDFTNNTNPAGTSTISVNNGTTLEDVALSDLMKLVEGVNRSVIINGAMHVAQRGTSVASITTSGYYTVDRWALTLSALGTWTMSQEVDAPATTPHKTSVKLLVTTADAAPAASDVAVFKTTLEGQHVQVFQKGLAAARGFALQFWVKSSTTGTYIVELSDADNTRHCAMSYTINAANTWEQKTINFPADATGAFDNDANGSLSVNFFLAAGTNFTSGTLATVWASTVTANRAVGQTNVAGTLNNTIFFTGVQLEPGSTNTSYENIQFMDTLRRCLRYFQKSFPYGTAPATNTGSTVGCLFGIAGKAGALTELVAARFPELMRAAPTITFYNPSAANAQARDTVAAADCSATAAATPTSADAIVMSCTGNAATAVGNAIQVHYAADSEL